MTQEVSDREDEAEQEEDEMLKIAIKESMITSARKEQAPAVIEKKISEKWQSSPTQDFMASFEPINAEDRQRYEREPVGLKNIGNSKQSLNTLPFPCSMLL